MEVDMKWLVGLVATPLWPAVGWLLRGVMDNGKRIAVLEKGVTVLTTDCATGRLSTHTDIEALKATQAGALIRVTRVEDAVSEVRGAMQKIDERFMLISLKLEALPALQVTLDGLRPALGNVVPRAEVEARLKTTEDRLTRVEDAARGRHADIAGR